MELAGRASNRIHSAEFRFPHRIACAELRDLVPKKFQGGMWWVWWWAGPARHLLSAAMSPASGKGGQEDEEVRPWGVHVADELPSPHPANLRV